MSEKRFIKYIPDEKAQWLRKTSPCAYLLLSQIAERARRYEGHPDGFEIGWALIGDYENAGLTHQEYRTAIDFLERHKFIEILHRGKKDKNSTIKTTIKTTINGTIVKLINSSVWDINQESNNNHDNNQNHNRVTIDQQSPNNEQERRKKEERINKELIAQTASPLRKEISFSFEHAKFENISAEDLATWKELYPAANLDIELKKMAQWCLSNLAKAKSKKLWRKFINNWLKTENEKSINREAFSRKSEPSKDNQDIARNFATNYRSSGYELVMDEKGVAIWANNGRGGNVEELRFAVHGFEDQLKAILEKRGFKRISKVENLAVFKP